MNEQPLKKRKKIISIDFGSVRIGFAISDDMKIFASALPNIDAPLSIEATAAATVTHIAALEKQGGYEIEEIIVGLPRNMNGTDSSTTDRVRQFIKFLEAKQAAPVIPWDERLTSVQAERSLLNADFSRKKRKEFVDRVSAAILLQSYLDLRSLKNQQST